MRWEKGNMPLQFKQEKEINLKKTVSLGSCFSRNIYRWLQHNNVVDANNCWDIFYNPFSILSEFKRVFEGVNWEEAVIIEDRGHLKRYIDPWRTWICKDNITELSDANKELDNKALIRLKESETIIITYGLAEVWRKKADRNIYLNNLPPQVIVQNSNSMEYESLFASNDEIDMVICETVDIIKKYINNDINIILTLSPVPLKFTFSDLSVREANNISKAKLLIAIRDVCNKYDNVIYFPAYDIVQGYSEQNYAYVWQSDNRHITACMVDFIAAKFVEFCNYNVIKSNELFSVPYVNEKGSIIGNLYTDKSYDIWEQ